jgi:hypothetical protein
MNLADTLQLLRRRWYIVVPGLLVACVLAFSAWIVVKPTYERSATQLLLPGAGSFAPNTGNPFLNLANVSQATDALISAMNSEAVAGKIADEHPKTTVVVARDWGNSGPSVRYTVTARSDAQADEILGLIVAQTNIVLAQLQDQEHVRGSYRIKAIPITFDTESTVGQKSRIRATAVVGVGAAALTIVLTALVDRMAVQRRRRGTSDRRSDSAIDAAEPVWSSPDGDLEAPAKGSRAQAGAMRFQDGSWLDTEAANSQDTVAANSQDTVAANSQDTVAANSQDTVAANSQDTGGSPSVDIPRRPQLDVEDTATEDPRPVYPRQEESFNT